MNLLSAKRKKAKLIVARLRQLFPKLRPTLYYSTPFECLVAVVLSAQNTDQGVNKAARTLFSKYPTIFDYAKADTAKLAADISSLNYYKTKAEHIVQSARLIISRFSGRVPSTMNELLLLPGVGRKTANVVLGQVYGKSEGIAVDTHVARLTRLWGLTEAKTPVLIEKELMSIITKKDWLDFTNLCIAYGRKYCPARPHSHNLCPLKV